MLQPSTALDQNFRGGGKQIKEGALPPPPPPRRRRPAYPESQKLNWIQENGQDFSEHSLLTLFNIGGGGELTLPGGIFSTAQKPLAAGS